MSECIARSDEEASLFWLLYKVTNAWTGGSCLEHAKKKKTKRDDDR
jgi:hypothetical protein